MRFIPTYEQAFCPECGRPCEPIYRDLGYGDWECVCNYCGSDEVERGRTCIMCGDQYLRTDSELYGVCPDCLDNIDFVIDEAVKKTMQGTTLSYQEARDYISDRIEEVRHDAV